MMKIAKKTIAKLERNGVGVDIGKYRYLFGQFGTIIRCPLNMLDTLPLNGKWEIVARWNNDMQSWEQTKETEYGY